MGIPPLLQGGLSLDDSDVVCFFQVQKIKTVKTSLAIVNRWRKTLEAGHSNKTVTVVLAATVNTSKANPTLNVIEIAGDTAIKSGRPNQKNRSFQRQLQPNEVLSPTPIMI